MFWFRVFLHLPRRSRAGKCVLWTKFWRHFARLKSCWRGNFLRLSFELLDLKNYAFLLDECFERSNSQFWVAWPLETLRLLSIRTCTLIKITLFRFVGHNESLFRGYLKIDSTNSVFFSVREDVSPSLRYRNRDMVVVRTSPDNLPILQLSRCIGGMMASSASRVQRAVSFALRWISNNVLPSKLPTQAGLVSSVSWKHDFKRCKWRLLELVSTEIYHIVFPKHTMPGLLQLR